MSAAHEPPTWAAGGKGCGGCGGERPAPSPDAGGLLERRRFVARALAAVAASLVPTLLGAQDLELLAAPTAARPVGADGDAQQYPVPPADGVQIDRENEVILVRWEGAVYAFVLACPHRSTALRWDESAHRFQCPKHRSRYAADGAFLDGRATRSMDRFGISRAGQMVMVHLDDVRRSDEDPHRWAEAVVRLP